MPRAFIPLFLFIAAVGASACDQRAAAADPRIAGAPVPAGMDSGAGRDTVPRVTHMPMPRIVRGLYVNRWAAIGAKMKQMIELGRTTEVNALVIDVKDDRGRSEERRVGKGCA